jgi:lipopolysaccharide export system protein LptA
MLFMRFPVLMLAALAVLAAVSSPEAWAEKADRNKPMNAEADALRYDDVKQQSVFTGNVVITKGTMTIRADRVEVRQDREGFQFGTATSTGAKRAFFRQKREGGLDEWIEGEAEVLSYDGKADTVTFTRNAVMRRLRGNTMVDETQGAVITYDNTTDVFNVSGGTNAAGAPSGRVRAVIGPRTESGQPATSPTPTPAPSTPARPTATVGGERK